jgi:hypothetical protein
MFWLGFLFSSLSFVTYWLTFCCAFLINFIASLLCVPRVFHCFLAMHWLQFSWLPWYVSPPCYVFPFCCVLLVSLVIICHLFDMHSWWVASPPCYASPICCVLLMRLLGTRDLRTLWSPLVSLNQEGHTQRRKVAIFIFILFIFCDKNSLKSPPWKHTWWSGFLDYSRF